MKVYELSAVRGPPPPEHSHINAIVRRRVRGKQCVETRVLCDGGELFDLLSENADGLPPSAVNRLPFANSACSSTADRQWLLRAGHSSGRAAALHPLYARAHV